MALVHEQKWSTLEWESTLEWYGGAGMGWRCSQGERSSSIQLSLRRLIWATPSAEETSAIQRSLQLQSQQQQSPLLQFDEPI